MSDPHASQNNRPQLRLLVVENHPPSAMVMRRLLGGEGFETLVVPSYQDAVRTATQWMPDVLISDIGLSDKDGTELIKTLQQSHPRLKGIAVSGYVTARDIQRSRDAGFSEHLSKPITADRLVAAIHRVAAVK